MMRMATEKPRLVLHSGTNDMGHYFPSYWEASGEPFWLTDDEFRGMWQFTDPSIPKLSNEEIREMQQLKDQTADERLMDIFSGAPDVRQIKWLLDLNPNKSSVWEFNGMTLDFSAFCRHVVLFGSRDGFVLSSWFDAYILYPLLKPIARVLNILWKGKQLKEMAEWKKYSDSVHKAIKRKK